jgi:hypothetical protein
MTVAAGSEALAGRDPSRVERVRFVSRKSPLLEGANSAPLRGDRRGPGCRTVRAADRQGAQSRRRWTLGPVPQHLRAQRLFLHAGTQHPLSLSYQ